MTVIYIYIYMRTKLKIDPKYDDKKIFLHFQVLLEK